MLYSCPTCAVFLTGGDEEGERKCWIAQLHLASLRSIQAVNVLTQEQEMLAAILRRSNEDVSIAQQEAEGSPSKSPLDYSRMICEVRGLTRRTSCFLSLLHCWCNAPAVLDQ